MKDAPQQMRGVFRFPPANNYCVAHNPKMSSNKRMRLSHTNTISRLPTDLLHVLCSFLTVFGIDALSLASRFMREECTKPGAWRHVHLPFHIRPRWGWLRSRMERSANAKQLKSIHLTVSLAEWQWLREQNSLESIWVKSLPSRRFRFHDFGRLTRLRVLRLGSVPLYPVQPLPASLEILHAPILNSLAGLASCQRLRVLVLSSPTVDVSVLPNLSGLRDLTLAQTLGDHLQHVAQCSQLVALRLFKIPRVDIGGLVNLLLLLDLPRDRLRTLALTGSFENASAVKLVSHFECLDSLRVSTDDLTSADVARVCTPSLLRLNISADSYLMEYPPQRGRSFLDGLRASPRLQELRAAFCSLQKFDGLQHCPQLRVLDIRGSKLHDVEFLVKHCPRLEKLALSTQGNRLHHLRRLQSLFCLNVLVCDDVRTEHVRGFPALRHLIIKDDILTTADVESLEHHRVRVSTLGWLTF